MLIFLPFKSSIISSNSNTRLVITRLFKEIILNVRASELGLNSQRPKCPILESRRTIIWTANLPLPVHGFTCDCLLYKGSIYVYVMSKVSFNGIYFTTLYLVQAEYPNNMYDNTISYLLVGTYSIYEYLHQNRLIMNRDYLKKKSIDNILRLYERFR